MKLKSKKISNDQVSFAVTNDVLPSFTVTQCHMINYSC